MINLLSQNIEELDVSLQRLYQRSFEKKTESLRIQLSDSPTQYLWNYDYTSLVIKEKKQRYLIGLALMSWYMTDEIRVLLQLQLEKSIGADVPYELMEILLNSKEYALTWLILQDWWNGNDLFGNVLNKELGRVWSRVCFSKKSKRRVKRYTGYCRGYRESNRRAPSPLSREHLAKSTVEQELQRSLTREMLTSQWRSRIEQHLAG